MTPGSARPDPAARGGRPDIERVGEERDDPPLPFLRRDPQSVGVVGAVQMLATEQSAVVVVGAGHLVGHDAIPELLDEHGIPTRRRQ